jgi:hypothetical protein
MAMNLLSVPFGWVISEAVKSLNHETGKIISKKLWVLVKIYVRSIKYR